MSKPKPLKFSPALLEMGARTGPHIPMFGMHPGLHGKMLGKRGDTYVLADSSCVVKGVYNVETMIVVTDLAGEVHQFEIPEGVRIYGEAKVKVKETS